MELQGKNVLITGAAVRIGAALCESFAGQGANLVIHCHQSTDDAGVLAGQLSKKYGVRCRTVALDLTLANTVDSLFSADEPVDVLINNAAVFCQESLDKESIIDGKHQFDVNFWAPMTLMKRFYQQDLPQGCIINILDQRINKVDTTSASYSLSKKALANLTEIAALQWAPRTRVNAIAPGPVLPPVSLKGEGMTRELTNVPLRKPVNLNDLADSCIFLSKNESITGEILFVDCGQHLNPT